MSLTISIHHLTADNLSVFHIIELELLCMSKMLKNSASLISYRNSHLHFLLPYILRFKKHKALCRPAPMIAFLTLDHRRIITFLIK